MKKYFKTLHLNIK